MSTTRYYEPPEDLSGTVFDPSSETFGPIMAALQAGEFEVADQLIRARLIAKAAPLAPEHFDMPVRVGTVTGDYYQGVFAKMRSNGMVTVTDEDGDRWVDLNPAHIVAITHDGEWAINPGRRGPA